jgi:pyruvate dehydrogenase E2 component (dihydrolipoamide acetyltransferase)
MAHLIRLPAMGQTMEEGTILRWFKREGERVEKGEPLAEIMTDKVNMEMEAPESGVLLKALAPVDATVPVQDPICVIGEPGEDYRSALGEAASDVASEAALPGEGVEGALGEPPDLLKNSMPALADRPTDRILSTPRARKTAEERGIDLSLLAGSGTGPEGRIQERDVLAYIEALKESPVRITPLAKRMAQETGITPQELVGSGPGGKIRSEDVLRAAEPSEPPLVPAVAEPSPFASRETRRVPLAPLRRIIADNVARSARTAPHVTLTSETDVTELARLREALLPDVEKRYGLRLTYTDLIVKATALALAEHPWLNSSFDGDAVLLHGDLHMGVAVAIPEGLVVPVLKNADAKSIPAISREIKDLAGRARENRLKPDEMAGGTFTITNLGGYGVDSFTPIINPPQCAILGVGRISKRPAFAKDGSVEARSFMNLCLSFDHRIVDGAPAAEFLRDLREMLENPYRILI